MRVEENLQPNIKQVYYYLLPLKGTTASLLHIFTKARLLQGKLTIKKENCHAKNREILNF